jgi:putative spermidine/putrescine transport system permease protein
MLRRSSLQIAAIATLIAMVLGIGFSRAVSPGLLRQAGHFADADLADCVAGDHHRIALLATFKTLGIEPGMFTIIVGHATFCVVISTTSSPACALRTV